MNRFSRVILSLIGFGFVSAPAMANDNSFILTLPVIAMNNQGAARGEYNLGGKGGIGVELQFVQQHNLYGKDEMKEKNDDSINMSGAEASVFYSSYGNSKAMSGGYWALGVGYRKVAADWKRTPDDKFQATSDTVLDENNRATHTLQSSGATAHARIGYRYVGQSFPIVLGAYVGLRHFQNEFRDVEKEKSTETPMDDREALSRRMMSAFEPGIEIGMSF